MSAYFILFINVISFLTGWLHIMLKTNQNFLKILVQPILSWSILVLSGGQELLEIKMLNLFSLSTIL